MLELLEKTVVQIIKYSIKSEIRKNILNEERLNCFFKLNSHLQKSIELIISSFK